MIIDFHTHTFPKSISMKAMETLSKNAHVRYFTDATIYSLVNMMRKSKVDYSVNQPVMTRVDQVVQVNDSLIKQKDELFSEGIITFGGLHPAYKNFATEIKRLKAAGIKGVKLHPAFQGVHINDISYKRIIDALSAEEMITLVHCGLDVGFMDQNYASVPELIDVIEDVRPERLILAHMGGWQAWDEVESYLAGANVYFDTAYSLGSVEPRSGEEDLMPFKHNLSKEAFVKLVRKHGVDRVLFASDSPWSIQSDYIDFVEDSCLSAKEKQMIYSENALSLLDLKLK